LMAGCLLEKRVGLKASLLARCLQRPEGCMTKSCITCQASNKAQNLSRKTGVFCKHKTAIKRPRSDDRGLFCLNYRLIISVYCSERCQYRSESVQIVAKKASFLPRPKEIYQ